MAIILDKPGFGAQLGSAFGGGLGKSLETLAQNKFQQMQQKQQEEQLTQGGLPGVLAHLAPQVQAQYFRGAQAAQIEAQKQQKEAQLSQLVEGILGQEGVEGQAPAAQDSVQSLLQQLQQPGGLAQAQLGGAKPEGIQRVSAPAVPQEPLSPGAKAARDIQNLEKQLQDPRLSGDQKSRLRERVEARQDRFDKKQDILDKKTAPFAEKINTDFEAASAGDQRIGRMKELIKEGNLNAPLFASVLDTAENAIPYLGIGINLKSFLSPESQEFDKLSKDFLRDVKKIFGARVTDNEVKQFLKTIPTLSQTDEGKLRIINNLELFNQAAKVKKQAFDDIIESNGGFRPQNIEQLVKKRTKKQLDAISNNFISGDKSKEDKALSKKVADRSKGGFAPVVAGAGIGTALGGPLGGVVGGALGASPLGQNQQLRNLLSSLNIR